MNNETFALIVGGGPVGLSAAIELNWRGVPNVLITENVETATHPKCNTTSSRSMEHFRRLGIAKELRSEALPADLERASAYVTRYCGHEFGRLKRAYADWPTPESPRRSPRSCSSARCARSPRARPARKFISVGSLSLSRTKLTASSPTL